MSSSRRYIAPIPREGSMTPTILLVDDDVKLLTFLGRTLKRAGYSVLTASDGCEVTDLMSQKRVDVLVLDLQMPGMNGWEVLRALHSQIPLPSPTGPRPRPKVVVLSGRAEDETAA